MQSEKITKVKFRDGGLGGMVVTFEKPSKRSNENFRDEYKVNYKAPVHKDLLAQKDKLTAHLRELCRLNEDVADEEIYLTEISSNAYDQFVLKGNVRTVGETLSPLKTANIQEGTGYDKFLDVTEIISDLYDEVRSYIHVDKKAQVDLVQYAIEFASKDKKAPEGVGEMNDEQKEMYAREFLERKGYITIQMEDPGDQIERTGNDGDDGGPTDSEIDGVGPVTYNSETDMAPSIESLSSGTPYPGSQEEATQYFKENPEGLFPDGHEESGPMPTPPQQPGFGQAPVETGKILSLNQTPAADPDDVGETRRRARSIK